MPSAVGSGDPSLVARLLTMVLVGSLLGTAGGAAADVPRIALAIEAPDIDAAAFRAELAERAAMPVVPLGERAELWLVLRIEAEGAIALLADQDERWQIRIPRAPGETRAWVLDGLEDLLERYRTVSTLRGWEGNRLSRRTAALLPWPAEPGDEVPDNPYALASRVLLSWSEADGAAYARNRELGANLDAPRP